VPFDVAVTGFDDDEAIRTVRPLLTTVDQDLFGQGRAAAELLLTILAGGDREATVLHPTRLLVNESSRHRDAVENFHDGLRDAVDPAELMRRQLSVLDTALAMNRTFNGVRTIREAMKVLADALPRLYVERCLVVLHQNCDSTASDSTASDSTARDSTAGHRHDRAVLRYAPGSIELDEVAEFPSITECLYDAPGPSGRANPVIVQPLTAGDTALGYVAFTQQDPERYTAEVLRLDLSRTLEMIERRQEVARYATELEAVVTARTRALNTEISTRIKVEDDLRIVNAELRRLLHVDGLTRIANRSAFDKHLLEQWGDHLTDHKPLALLLVDVDYFKAYNDRYGHLSGDSCLTVIASVLDRAARGEADLAARYGGEEFALILPRTDAQGGVAVARRVMALLAEHQLPHDASSVSSQVTVSIGVTSTIPGPMMAPNELIAAADEALYKAKASGRNTIATGEMSVPH
jgi:diguanylate cyclase (GGDEF)-like protein